MPATDATVTATFEVATSVVNHPPVADPQAVAVTANVAKAISLTAHDVDGDALDFRIEVPPAKGLLSGTSPGLVYTPFAGVTGPDVFVFTVHDGHSASLPAVVQLGLNAATNPPPSVALTAPADGTWRLGPADITLAAVASDPDGIRGVDFFAGTNRIGSVTNAPFSMVWRQVPPGDYQVFAKAFDALGARSFSVPARVSVLAADPRLSVRSLSPQQVMVSWPLALARFQLEGSPDAAGPWSLVTQSVADTATEHTVTVPHGTARFFRLVQDR